MRLLVVDDQKEITKAITFYLSTDQTIECEVINDGPQGLEKIRNGKFDLLLLGIAMPEFTGWDILESLKNDGLVESKNIVIFMTSWDQQLFDDQEPRCNQERSTDVHSDRAEYRLGNQSNKKFDEYF